MESNDLSQPDFSSHLCHCRLFENIKNTPANKKKKSFSNGNLGKQRRWEDGASFTDRPTDRVRSVGLMEWKIEESEPLYLSADRSQKSQSKTR